MRGVVPQHSAVMSINALAAGIAPLFLTTAAASEQSGFDDNFRVQLVQNRRNQFHNSAFLARRGRDFTQGHAGVDRRALLGSRVDGKLPIH